MSAIRRQMRVCVALWALGQSALLTALLPRDCCASHPSTAHAQSSAREAAAAPGDHCAMTEHDAPAAPATCTIRAECNGPLAALASLLSAQGVTPEVQTPAIDLQSGPHMLLSSDPVVASSTHPDTPPPRA